MANKQNRDDIIERLESEKRELLTKNKVLQEELRRYKQETEYYKSQFADVTKKYEKVESDYANAIFELNEAKETYIQAIKKIKAEGAKYEKKVRALITEIRPFTN